MPPAAVARATSGAASRLASGASSGIVPKCASSSGATATWAAVVAPSAVHAQRGRRWLHMPAPASTPAVAATLNWNPASVARPPATASSTATAAPSAVQPSTGTPASTPPSTMPAITEARTTDGSQRVTTTKRARPANPASALRRGPQPSGPSATHQAARKSATFDPETAT